MFLNIYIYIERERERELSSSTLTPSITLSNIMPLNNLLLNSYFGNLTVELCILYVLNMYFNFHAHHILFTILSINSFFMYYFKL